MQRRKPWQHIWCVADFVPLHSFSTTFRLHAISSSMPLSPPALTIPYVQLRCTLNRFARVNFHAIGNPSTRDLGSRARAEVALAVAA